MKKIAEKKIIIIQEGSIKRKKTVNEENCQLKTLIEKEKEIN